MIKFILKTIFLVLAFMYAAHSIVDNAKPLRSIKINKTKTILLTKKNTVNIRGTVTWESVAQWGTRLAFKVLQRESSIQPIYLVIDSPGGSITAGQSFIRLINQFDNIHTVTIFAASMASAIVEAVPGKRYALSDAEIMFHRATATISGQIESGELEERVRRVQRIVKIMEVSNADRIGISLADYKKKVKDEWWLGAREAVKLNVVDRIVRIKCTKALLNTKEISLVDSIFGSRKLSFSGCPLLQFPLAIKE